MGDRVKYGRPEGTDGKKEKTKKKREQAEEVELGMPQKSRKTSVGVCKPYAGGPATHLIYSLIGLLTR